MIRGQEIENDRFYDKEHIATLRGDMISALDRYYLKFAPDREKIKDRMKAALDDFDKEQQRYLDLLDPDYLEEYEYDPNAFNRTMRKDCPIIRRCLNSPAKVMDAYRSSFNATSGNRMLVVSTNIVQFAMEFADSFSPNQFEGVRDPEDLGFSLLDSEPYSAYGVIGGGIRSHFLHNLYPDIFPNRSQNAVWAYYFLTDRKDYDFEDSSEFLMVDPDGSGAQHNYFYPYDLFSYYALKLYTELKRRSKNSSYYFDDQYRYVYLDTFLDLVANKHRDDINALKPPHERFDN